MISFSCSLSQGHNLNVGFHDGERYIVTSLTVIKLTILRVSAFITIVGRYNVCPHTSSTYPIVMS